MESSRLAITLRNADEYPKTHILLPSASNELAVKIFLDCPGMSVAYASYIRIQINDCDQRNGKFRVEFWNHNCENDFTLFFHDHPRIVGETNFIEISYQTLLTFYPDGMFFMKVYLDFSD